MEIIPYLGFGGRCEEAVNSYLEAFGGEILGMSYWSEMNCEKPELLGKVMHTEFFLGNTHMAAGDDSYGKPNDIIKLMIHMDSMEKAQHAISVLAADGGEALAPLKPHPAPDDSGCGSITRDRFGFFWIITCPNPDKQ